MIGSPVFAATIEPARVRVAAGLVDDLVRRLLPVELVLPGPIGGSGASGVSSPSVVVAITELKYCGASERGTGRFRAVIRSGPLGGAGAPILVGDDGCRQPLGDLAKRLAAGSPSGDGGGAVSVADVEAVWRPWELRLILVRTNAPAPPKPGPPQPLAPLENRSELLVVSTSGLRIAAGAADAITVHAAPGFAPEGVEILAVWAEGGSAPPAVRPLTSGAVGGLTGGVNATADLPFGFANQILRHIAGAQPAAIRIDREVVDLQNLSIAPSGSASGPAPGSGAGAAVTGLATLRSVRETMRVMATTGGSELRVIAVRAEAQQETCAGLGTLATAACNARNAGRSAAAAVFGASVTQKYQGQLVRDLSGALDLRVEIAGRRLDLGGDVLHVAPTGRGLSVGARLAAGGPEH